MRNNGAESDGPAAKLRMGIVAESEGEAVGARTSEDDMMSTGTRRGNVTSVA